MERRLEWFRDLYEAFNRRDVPAVLSRMTPDVDWPNGWQGGRVTGQTAVGEYWAEQWAQISPEVHPLSVELRPDGSMVVAVRQVVSSLAGELLAETRLNHVYVFRDDLISRMEIEELPTDRE
jgi:ketosteroid isomerase-like protein